MEVPSRRFWVRSGLVLVLAFMAIQFVPYGGDHRVERPNQTTSAAELPEREVCICLSP